MDDYEILKQRMGALSGAIFLFALAALILAHISIFPAVLPLIWLSTIPILIADQGWKYGLWILAQMGIWLGGIPLLIEVGQVFPGILVLAGMSTLLVAIAPPDKLERERQEWVRQMRSGQGRKRKRLQDLALPLPREDEDDDQSVWIEDDDESAYAARSGHRRE